MSRSGNTSQIIKRSSGIRWLWLSLGVLIADRASKFAIERYTPVFFRRSIISDIVVLVHNQNPGIAFGVFSDSNPRTIAPILLVPTLAMILLLIWLLATGRAGGALAQSGIATILGGAAGNAVDRLIHGSVTDFLEVRLWMYIWPSFNVADSAIVIGAALVLMELLFGGRQLLNSSEKGN